MSRDLVFFAAVLGLGGAVIWLGGWAPFGTSRSAAPSARRAERTGWRALWLPFVPAALALGALLGWAAQEPRRTDELLRPTAPLWLAPLALVWLRALLRAAVALRRPRRPPLAATVGLLRPRVVIAPALADALDPAALLAARAHEEAHRRHRDPLRLWLAQAAADLQWPNPQAATRLTDWRRALEMARDEEARTDGVDGSDLAAALVGAARHAGHHGAGLGAGPGAGPGVAPAVARLLEGERALVERVARLLAPLRASVGARGSRRVLTGLLYLGGAAALAAALLFGFRHGDLLMRALPFIRG